MNLPKILRKEHRAPVVLAVILTFVGWNAFGFGWFGLPNLGFVYVGWRGDWPLRKWKE